MKTLYLTLLLALTGSVTCFSQTTLTEDANGVLNTNKIVAQTSSGQIFYTGHQLGSGYAMPYGIFRAITDNPGGGNYFYDGLLGSTTTFSVRSDGQGYFASNIGIGTTTPMGRLDVNFSNSEPKNAFVFSSPSNPTYNPVGGIRFAWYGTNFADIQMVRQGNSNDGLGLSFHTSTSNNSTTIERMRITAGGNVIIGNTTQSNPSYILDVWGNVRAKQITVNTTGADFVFEPSYRLNTLTALKDYIAKNHHLPEIASAKEMQRDGLNVGENQVKLLQKVEELTLYMIEKDKQLNEEKKLNSEQEAKIDSQDMINKQLSEQLKSQQAQIDQLKAIFKNKK